MALAESIAVELGLSWAKVCGLWAKEGGRGVLPCAAPPPDIGRAQRYKALHDCRVTLVHVRRPTADTSALPACVRVCFQVKKCFDSFDENGMPPASSTGYALTVHDSNIATLPVCTAPAAPRRLCPGSYALSNPVIRVLNRAKAKFRAYKA